MLSVLSDQREIVGGILDAEELVRAIHAPAVLSGAYDRSLACGCAADRGSRLGFHAVVLARRSERLMIHASVSGTLTNSSATPIVGSVGWRSTIVS